MDTRNWFGEHAHTVRLFALIGGVVLAAIILVDIMTQKAKAGATSATTTPNANGTTTPPTSSLNPGETNISVFQDYSSHVGANANDYTGPVTTTSNQYAAPASKPASNVAAPAAHQGGPVPVATPHPATHLTPHPAAAAHPTYTVRRGDSLWSIAAAKLGSGYNWQELYNWNRSVVGSNPNLIYPGEVLALN